MPTVFFFFFFFFFFLRNLFIFALQALLPLRRCPFSLMTSSEVMHPGSFLLLSPFVQKGRMEVGSLGMPLCSQGFSSPARLGPAGGVGEPLVTRSVHASSLLSPQFIRGLGIQELLSCSELLLSVLSRLVLPPHLCTLAPPRACYLVVVVGLVRCEEGLGNGSGAVICPGRFNHATTASSEHPD